MLRNPRQYLWCIRCTISLAILCLAGNLRAQDNLRSDSLLDVLERSVSRKDKTEILNQMSRELRRSHPDSAIAYANEALEISSEDGDSLGMANACLMTGMVYRYQFKLDIAREWLLRAYGIFQRFEDDEKIGQCANMIGITYGIQASYELSERYFSEALQANIRTGNKYMQAECQNNLGNVTKYKGDYARSAEYYRKALVIYEELGDSSGIGQIYNHLGILYDYQGNYRQSLEHYFAALRILENTENLEDLAATTGNIGVCYNYLEEYEKALEYAYRQLKIEEQIGDKRGLAIVLNNIGQFHENLGHLEEALEYQEQSLVYKRELGLQDGIANGYQNIGNIYSKMGRNEDALEIHLKALVIRRQTGNKHGIALSLVNTASVYRKLGRLQKSNQLAHEAYEMAGELGSPMFLEGAARVLAGNYEDLGNYRRALEYQKIWQEWSDSLRSDENIKEMTRLEMQYDFDKQQQARDFEQQQEVLAYEAEVRRQKILAGSFIGGFILVIILAIVILRGYIQKRRANALLAEQKEEILSMNEEIQAINDQLQESLSEKEVLLKEIHHRVKNNLQIISSLLNLQSRDVSDEAVQDAVLEGQSRVKSMALIHQMLYQSEQISRIRFDEYLNQLVSSLSSMYKGEQEIEWKVEAGGIDLDIDTAIPLGLIINELVSNSFKYAFAGRASGNISINMMKSNGHYTLKVADNGVGMPEELLQGNTTTLGIRLVNILTSQLNGNLEREAGEGTRIIIKFEESR